MANEEITHAYIHTIRIQQYLNHIITIVAYNKQYILCIGIYKRSARDAHRVVFYRIYIIIPLNYSNRKCPRPSTAHKHDPYTHALTLETQHRYRVGNQLLYFTRGIAAADAKRQQRKPTKLMIIVTAVYTHNILRIPMQVL